MRPPPIAVEYENIPAELKALNQWVLFRLEGWNGKKWSKVPYQLNGQKASSTNPNHWATFDQARCEYELIGGVDGIGFVFSPSDSYCGIDLDHCVNPNTKQMEPWALKWLVKFSGAYIEYSPSGTGIHIYTKGVLPQGRGRKIGFYEIYDQSRFFTVTGQLFRDCPEQIQNQQSVIDEFLQEIFFDQGKAPTSVDLKSPLQGTEITPSEIQEIISKAKAAKNGEKFSRLFSGDTSDFGGDASRADSSLCEMLAFWTDGNETAIDQTFRVSGLCRAKWKERFDYRARTIRNAVEHFNESKIKNDFGLGHPDNSAEETGPFPIIHISAVEDKPIEYQIQDLWLKESVGIISGQPGVCKTWFALALAVSIAAGRKALGEFQAANGKALIFNAEDHPARITKKRVRGFSNAYDTDLRDIDFHLIQIPSMDLGLEATRRRMRETVAKEKPDFIVLDPIRDIHSLDEDKSSQMSTLLRFLRELNREFECSILLVCHDRKPSGDNTHRASQTRGSNSLQGWRDTAIYMDEVDHEQKISKVQIYHRGVEAVLPFFVKLSVASDEKGEIEKVYLEKFDYAGLERQKEFGLENEIKKILIKNRDGLTRSELVKESGKQKKRALAVIRSMLNLGALSEHAPRSGEKAPVLKFPFPEPQGTGTSLVSSGSTPYKGGTENPLDQNP